MGRGKPRAGTEISETDRLEQLISDARQVIGEMREVKKALNIAGVNAKNLITHGIEDYLKEQLNIGHEAAAEEVARCIREAQIIAIHNFKSLTTSMEDILKSTLTCVMLGAEKQVSSGLGHMIIEQHRKAVDMSLSTLGMTPGGLMQFTDDIMLEIAKGRSGK